MSTTHQELYEIVRSMEAMARGKANFDGSEILRNAALLRSVIDEMKACKPIFFAYKYPDNSLRMTNGEQVNGCDPIGTVPLFSHALPLSPSVREALKQMMEAFKHITPGEWWSDGDTADVFAMPEGSTFKGHEKMIAKCACGDDWRKNANFISLAQRFALSLSRFGIWQ